MKNHNKDAHLVAKRCMTYKINIMRNNTHMI